MKKFLTTFAVLTVFATPAFSQSFDPDTGTGNVLAFSHTPTAPQNEKIAGGRRALDSFAMVPSSRSAFDSESPQATGGGSIGYNEMLRNF
jgi:hypothetical protein